MIVKVDDVLLKAEGQPEHRTRRCLALCVLMTLISVAVPIAAAVLYAHATALVSPDPSGSMAAWATNERPVRSEVRSCDAAGVELPPYSVSLVSL